MKKKNRILKLMAAMLLAGTLSLNAQNVSFNNERVTLKQAFEKIESVSNYKIAYNSSQIDVNKQVVLNQKNKSVLEVIKELLKGTDYSYEVKDYQIVIVPKKSQANTIAVTGNVKDELGESVIGASIMEKGTTNGVVTDYDGNFTLSVPADAIIVVSYIGSASQEIAVKGRHELQITLKEDNNVLNEVVVVGYGTQKKGDITSSVGSVKSEDFTQGAINDAGQLIQGKIAGLSVTNPSGDPTGKTEISLRGNTTILGASTNPLILIDGVPGDFNTVAPEDMGKVIGKGGRIAKSIRTVVKAAASGEDKICNADDYRQQISAGLRDASWDKGSNTDWLDEITRTPFSHVHNLSFKGGTQKTNYVFNLNYRSIQGIFKRSDKQEFQGRAEVNHNMFNDKLLLNFSILGNQTGYTSTSDGGSFNTYCYRQALIHNPTEPVKNPDGSWYENTGIFEYDNPVARLYESDGKQDITQLRVNANITFNPIQELSFKALLSYDKTHQYGGYYETKNHISTLRDGRNGYAATGASTDMTKLLEITAQFRKTFGDHNLSVLAGYSYQKMNYENQYEQNWDFPTDLYSYHNIGTGNALKEGLANMYSYKLESNLIGFFGRLNYSYKNRYLLMASIRHEAASQLAGTEKPWGTFPSVSLGWRITEEKFMENQKVFDDIKLRAGYGVTGSQPSQSFLGKSMLGYGDYYYYNGQWIQALQPTQNANPYLKWEEKHEYDVGVDFSVLNYRINVSIDWYYRLIKGLLYDYSVPSPPNLYTTTRANVGEMSNSGLEVMVNAIPVKTQKFEWNSTVTFSTNTNKLKSLSNELYQASSDYFMSGWIQEPVKTESHIVRIGHPVGEIYGFKVVDVDENGKWIYENKDGQLVGYDDFTHSFEDKKVLGNGLPKWHLGFNNTFRYKDWDLSVNMRGAFGFQIINCARMFYENRSRQDWNRLKSAYDKVFGKALLNTGCAEEFNSYYVENGDYWKIDNITLGYRFRNVCKFINSIRVYGSVNNALTITGYKGVDPEVSTSGLAPGYDNRDQYPHTRSFTVGANITF